MPSQSPSFLRHVVDQVSGEQIYELATEIYPICRSITGDGVRETLRRLARNVALQVHEVPSGTAAFDWTVPKEWNIRDAYIKNSHGERVVDFQDCNLHVVSYSTPVHGHFRLQDLRPHIFTLPDQPDLIPYKTSYYENSWGFCMAHDRLRALPDDTYEVMIDSSLEDGSLTYGEFVHVGDSDQQILLSAHVCHPSLANDNCSGLALLTCLAEQVAKIRTRYTYRFIFAPGTIGAIVWLARNEHLVQRIANGLIVSCVGDRGGPIYKRSRRGDSAIDRAMAHVMRHLAPEGRLVDFSPYGYDERQYCSPGFNLPVGLFQRSQFATFPEYHTSGDNLNLIRPDELARSYRMIVTGLNILEHDRHLRNLNPKCEPQLGKRGLYSSGDEPRQSWDKTMAMLWVLNLSDGINSLLDIAERAGMAFAEIHEAASRLETAELVERC